jgi:molybdopterin synthase sulfur carrier subunit
MSAQVRIPTILRTFTGGQNEVEASGHTVAHVLESSTIRALRPG